MIDMTAFIAARSDQLNADDLIDGPRTITITKVTAQPDAAEQPVSIHYEGGEGRPLKPCKTVRRILVAVWGKDASKYAGRSMTVYRDPKVQFSGMQVGGIRVSHMSHIDEPKTIALLVTRGRKAPYTVQPLKAAPAQTTEDAAVNWANGYIAKLAGFESLDALQAFKDEKAAKLAELSSRRPELHQKVTTALFEREAELSGGSNFDDDLTKPAALSSRGALQEIIGKITAATDQADVDAIDKDTEFDRQFLTEQQCDDLDAALAVRRTELREQRAEAANG